MGAQTGKKLFMWEATASSIVQEVHGSLVEEGLANAQVISVCNNHGLSLIIFI